MLSSRCTSRHYPCTAGRNHPFPLRFHTTATIGSTGAVGFRYFLFDICLCPSPAATAAALGCGTLIGFISTTAASTDSTSSVIIVIPAGGSRLLGLLVLRGGSRLGRQEMAVDEVSE